MAIPDSFGVLKRLSPTGCVDLDEGTVAHTDMAVVAQQLDDLQLQMNALETESRPQDTVVLLSRWEALLGLRAGAWTTAERIARLLARIRHIPSQTPAEIEARVEQYSTIAWTLSEPGPFRCDQATSVCDNVNDVVDGAFVFFLDADWTAADAIALRRDDLSAFVGRLKPAHTVGRLRFDDFRCDDAYSTCDRDLLGA